MLKEIAAPEGYQVAEDITFAVGGKTCGNGQSSRLRWAMGGTEPRARRSPEKPEEPSTPDEPTEPEKPTPTVPQTGGSRMALWVGALLILALGGLGITLILLKRQNKL